jgi:hypothetical protein
VHSSLSMSGNQTIPQAPIRDSFTSAWLPNWGNLDLEAAYGNGGKTVHLRSHGGFDARLLASYCRQCSP